MEILGSNVLQYTHTHTHIYIYIYIYIYVYTCIYRGIRVQVLDFSWNVCRGLSGAPGAVIATTCLRVQGLGVGSFTNPWPTNPLFRPTRINLRGSCVRRRWRSNISETFSQQRLTRGTVIGTTRRAAHPSGCGRCGAGAGCSAIKYQSLQPPVCASRARVGDFGV